MKLKLFRSFEIHSCTKDAFTYEILIQTVHVVDVLVRSGTLHWSFIHIVLPRLAVFNSLTYSRLQQQFCCSLYRNDAVMNKLGVIYALQAIFSNNSAKMRHVISSNRLQI